MATEVFLLLPDVDTTTPMTEQTVANTGAAPAQLLADAGYSSTANLDWATRIHHHLRHRVLHRPRTPPPRRPTAGRPTRTYPHRRHRQARA